MKGSGQAIAHGAVTIVNAFATGKGGAIGVDLWTRSRVTLREGHGTVAGLVSSDPRESPDLIVRVAEKTIEHYGYAGKVAGEVVTTSNIPIAVGLKSSSAAANATALATSAALGEKPDDDTMLDIGIESSLECGVSLTGAFDDSYASYFGGAVLADNGRRKVEKIPELPRGLRLILLVPDRKRYTGKLDRASFQPISALVNLAYREALSDNLWDAMTLNGLAYSSILKENQQPVLEALSKGAVGAGISGKGPAIVSVSNLKNSDKVKEALRTFQGKIIETFPNTTKATIEDVGES